MTAAGSGSGNRAGALAAEQAASTPPRAASASPLRASAGRSARGRVLRVRVPSQGFGAGGSPAGRSPHPGDAAGAGGPQRTGAPARPGCPPASAPWWLFLQQRDLGSSALGKRGGNYFHWGRKKKGLKDVPAWPVLCLSGFTSAVENQRCQALMLPHHRLRSTVPRCLRQADAWPRAFWRLKCQTR